VPRKIHPGWVVLAALCCVGFARQGPAVATLSIFVEPLTREFGWSRAALSGAVSLAGVLAAVISPGIGSLLDRHGPRMVLCIAVLVNAAALVLLSFTPSLLVFYVLFCIARTNWAVPFDLGIYGAINSWFIARRTFATSVATMAQIAGLVAMPLIAQAAIASDGWRSGWVALGVVTLLVGFLPVWLFLGRRPEDMEVVSPPGHVEPDFSRAQAMRSPAFWLLMVYTVLIFPVQAGVSLHQAAHLVERGIAPASAAAVVSVFSLMAGLGTFACGFLPRRLPIRFAMAVAGVLALAGTLLMTRIGSAAEGTLAGGVFGFGIGAVLTLLPVAWADYFGRANYGAIRGLALSAQVLSQAAGPILSGALHDLTGNYLASLYCFVALSALTIPAALAARPPRR
jgi:MFS transporter, OFA family, oxalate/formate antiporter